MRRLLLTGLACALGWVGPVGGAAEQEPEALLRARADLRAGRYAEAASGLARLLQTQRHDEAAYLQALALYQEGRKAASEQAAAKMLEAYPDSGWRRKALFLRARALLDEKAYEGAERIYEEEAFRLLSEERKTEIAGAILSVADELSSKPDPADLAPPAPDYNKALALYGKVLQMEIGRELREQVMFKQARATQRAGHHGRAVNEFQAYLREFDPAWTGPAGSVERARHDVKRNPPPPGRQRFRARFRLAEMLLKAGRKPEARREAEDLLRLLDAEQTGDAGLRADAAYVVVRSYGMPRPSSGELERAVKAAHDFRAAHPRDPRGVVLAFRVAETYREAGRSEEAIAAFRAFAEGESFKLPEGEAASEELEAFGKSPLALSEEWGMAAVYQTGALLNRQARYEEAIDAWQGYVNRFPNGPRWSACQNGIVQARFQQGLMALAEKREEEARRLFEEFLKAYPLDARARQILFTFGQLHFARAAELERQDGKPEAVRRSYRSAVEEWAKLVSKYPNTEESSLALYRTGMIHEEKLGDLDQALATYRRLTWGSCAQQARERVANMTRKHLAMTTERTFRAGEPVSVRLNVRNIEKLTFKQYYLDLEAYFRKRHEIDGVEGLDTALIEADRTWEVEIEDYERYRPIEQQVEIPYDGDRPGVCIVNAADDDWEVTTLVIRSDLDIIVKSSRRQVLVFAQDRTKNNPARDVDLLISDGEKVFLTGKTGRDGVFLGESDKLRDAGTVRVFAMRDGHAASHNLGLEHLGLSSGLSAKGYIYTDRTAYQPGQTVSLRGVIRDVREGAYAVPEAESFMLSITDAQGRLMREEKVTLSAFGTFHASFDLPESAPLGQYQATLRADPDKSGAPVFNGTILVQRFKLEKIRLDWEFPRRVYFRGERIEAVLKAAYYWGEPLAGKPVSYTLPDGRRVAARTDKEGRVEVGFDTTAMTPGSMLAFQGRLDEDNLTAAGAVALAREGFRLAVSPAAPLVLAGEPLQVNVTATGADGKPVGRDLTLTVLRFRQPHTDALLDMIPWLSKPRQPPAEVTVTELALATDAETGRAKGTVKLDKGGRYVLRVAGRDRFDQVITGQAMVTVSDDDDATRLRLFSETDVLKVGAEAELRLHSRLAKGLALVTHEGEEILRYDVVPIDKGFNALDFAVEHQHFPNFRVAVAAMDGRELRTAARAFRVERELKVAVEPLRETWLPGEEARVALTATDQLGRPVEAELSLALIDEALFASFPERRPSILDFFQEDAQRQAEFRTGSTCGFEYAGSARRVLKEMLEEGERLARREEDRRRQARFAGHAPGSGVTSTVAEPDACEHAWGKGVGPIVSATRLREANKSVLGFDGYSPPEPSGGEVSGQPAAEPRREMPGEGRWFPAVVTDRKGRAEIRVRMPEKTARWRLTARGCSVETLVGQAVGHALTKKDFFVDLKAPPSVQEGDAVRFMARLHNLTDYRGSAALRLVVRDAFDHERVLAERRQEAAIEGRGGAEAVFQAVTLAEAGRVRVEITAEAGGLADALSLELPVRPWGIEYADHGGGVARADTALVLELPAGQRFTGRWLTVSVGPDMRAAVLDLALDDSPAVAPLRGGDTVGAGRCFVPPPPPAWGRSAGSDLLAAVSGLVYARRTEAPQLRRQALAERVRALVAGLVLSQHRDGSWGWQGAGKGSDWAATARAFWGLARARQAGFAVNADTLAKVQTRLQNWFRSFGATDNDAKAVVLHALSVRGAADYAHCNRLYRVRNGLSNAALAYTALAFVNLERPEMAAELSALLESRASAGRRGERETTFWKHGARHTWMRDDLETTALSLLALVHTRPDSPQADGAVEHLLNARGTFGFAPAKARGPAAAALAAHYGRGEFADADLKIEVHVNGTRIGGLAAEGQAPGRTWQAPAELLREGRNLVAFKMSGRGTYAYAATLRGFSPEFKAPRSWSYPRVKHRDYRHAPLEYRGRRLGTSSSSPVRHLEAGQPVHVRLDISGSHHRGYLAMEEPLPAGAMLVEGSLRGNFTHYEVGQSKIVMYYPPDRYIDDVSYELVGYAPGRYRVLPTVMYDVLNPGLMKIGPTKELDVLAPGEPSPDPYKMNHGELYFLGTAYFEDGLYDEAMKHLGELFKRARTYNEREVARMLLWIHTAPDYYDARRIVEMFEILRERHPQLRIPFDKILVVGKAYRDIGEYERAWLVYRATIAASFISDSNVSAVLQDQGRFLKSIAYQRALWREYPDTAEVVSSYFALAQALYDRAPQAHTLPREGGRRPDEPGLLREAVRMLDTFLTLYPADPLADDAAFSMANVFLELKDFETVVELGQRFEQRYQEGKLASSFRYMTALGHFWLREYEPALDAARAVAEGESADRDFARYIVGQIHHAQGQPAQAIDWYGKVEDRYPDAAQAIAYFEEKRIAMDEVTILRPGEPVKVPLRYRNIRTAALQVYRVDLMKLYLREKNLSNITRVRLAGIRPQAELELELGDGKDYIEKTRTAELPLEQEGAYLVICRGDDLFASGLVLITPLTIEVQEDAVSGRVRANVLDAVEGGYRAGVHVKAIGSADKEFKQGETDLRGIVVADGLRGKATLIAREGDARYAFHRGEQWLGAPRQQEPARAVKPVGEALDYQHNLRLHQKAIQQLNIRQFDRMRRVNQVGVEVQMAQ